MSRIDGAYREHRSQLRRYISSKVADRETVEDILQDIFVRAINANAVEPIEHLAAWLFRTASNRIVDWYRRRFRSDVSMEDEKLSLEGLLASSEIELHDAMVRELVFDELYRAIDELPDSQREVLVRQAIGGETFREISEESGVSVNTLLARKRYAVSALRRSLQDIKETIQELLAQGE